MLNGEQFLKDLDFLLSYKIGKPCEIEIFCSDIILNILEINNLDVSQYLNCLSEMAYHSIINKATKIDKISVTCIDHLFLNFKNLLSLNFECWSFRSLISLNLNLNKSIHENKHSQLLTKLDNPKLFSLKKMKPGIKKK